MGFFKNRSKNTNKLPMAARVSLFFYDRPKSSALLWIIVLAVGIASYTTFLKREGFPSIEAPYGVVSGTYLVNDAEVVDRDVGKPLSNIIGQSPDVKFSDVSSYSNFFNAIIQFEEGTDAKVAVPQLQQKIDSSGALPAEAKYQVKPLSFGVNERGDDMLVAFYSDDNSVSLEELVQKANQAVQQLKNDKNLTQADRIEVIDPFARGKDPVTGTITSTQKSFDRFGNRQNNQSKSYVSVNIGITGVKGFDVLELDDQVQSAVDSINQSQDFQGFSSSVAYSIAPSINDQINGLQKALAEGLIAILVVSAILIALRASLITVLAMVVVIMATLGVLLGIGYSLNTITLFSLVLCLSLIVDDTIIMVEAIDAQRRKLKNAREVIEKSAKKISRVMVAATLTAAMAFAPLIFVGGVLGEFIRAIPVTVITSLLVSLFVALTFIPFLSRFVLLRRSQLGKGDEGKKESVAHHLERFIAGSLARPLLWTNHHRKRQVGLGLVALGIGIGFIVAGGMLFSKVGFNIFAPSKDSNQIQLEITFEPGKDINQTQKIADEANEIIKRDMGANLEQFSYFDSGNTEKASVYINLISFRSRSVTAIQLADKLDKNLNNEVDGALFQAGQLDVGPPVSAFGVRIQSTNKEGSQQLAKDVSKFLENVQLERPDGTVASMKNVTASNPDSITRRDGNRYIVVKAEFDGDDTSTLVILAQDAVKKEYTKEKLATFGLKSDVIKFDIGQEEENQDSFKTLLIAFPILLLAIYLLLTLQFKSLLQPILIFTALPFSLFGITTGLWLTDNAFSFFTMLGFFALIGLSIKNTILLTDYANQSRRDGETAVEAAASALKERFRPLIATSLTAVVSLIPLYYSDPFWEGLTVTLMFGLISSTFLVVTVFPYYYLGAEYLRLRIRRRVFAIWLLLCAVQSFIFVKLDLVWLVPIGILVTSFCLPYILRSFAKSK